MQETLFEVEEEKQRLEKEVLDWRQKCSEL